MLDPVLAAPRAAPTGRIAAAVLLGAALFLLAGCAGLSSDGSAQANVSDYPSKPISYVVPFDPGGEADTSARIFQPHLERVLGTSVIVSNKPGGGGALGWSELTRTEPDGYTIMHYALPNIITQPLTNPNAGYEADQIKQVYIFQSTPNVLVVPENSSIESLEDLVNEARDNPGAVTLGGVSDYSPNHIGTLELNEAAGIELTYVPFSGTAAATPALLGGQVKGLMTYTPNALQLQEQGVKVLAVAAEERVPYLPDVPTFKELGYNIVGGAHRGIAVPPETPDEIVDKLTAAFREVNNDPEVVEQFEEIGGYTLEDMGPEEAQRFTQELSEEYTQLFERLGLVQ
jgi:tripartite-type tricarboxylate transporter receptor subunit TctC